MADIPQRIVDIAAWIEEERCGQRDLEFYAEFNEQYQPADWTRNDAANDELLTFAQDGAGGQYALWSGQGEVETAPVVKLGDDGDLIVLAKDVLDFAWLIACGIDPIGVNEDGEFNEDSEPSDAMQAWVREQAPGREFGDPPKTLAAAGAAFPDLVAHVRSLCLE